MSSQEVQASQGTKAREILARISSIAERIKRQHPTKIAISDGNSFCLALSDFSKSYSLTTLFLENMGGGISLIGAHWKNLVGLLLLQRDHKVVISVVGTAPKLEQGQIGVHLRSSYTRDALNTQDRRQSDKHCWCILTYRLSSNVVNIYTTGLVREDRKCRGSIADALGLAPYKLQLNYHQVRSTPL
jgi:hypothetical protein